MNRTRRTYGRQIQSVKLRATSGYSPSVSSSRCDTRSCRHCSVVRLHIISRPFYRRKAFSGQVHNKQHMPNLPIRTYQIEPACNHNPRYPYYFQTLLLLRKCFPRKRVACICHMSWRWHQLPRKQPPPSLLLNRGIVRHVQCRHLYYNLQFSNLELKYVHHRSCLSPHKVNC